MNERVAFDLECAAAQAAPPLVAGADEVGRGALAGPLVAAAVCFDYAEWTADDFSLLGAVNDSKRVAPARRQLLYRAILARARQVSVVVCAAARIDERGLQACNVAALAAALAALQPAPPVCLVDGYPLPAGAPPHRAVVGGDGRSAAVAAASIVAKVTRDRLMARLDGCFPGWGFAEHVGYATPSHHEAIARLGVCVLHRRSFQSVAYRQLGFDLRE